MTLDDPIIVTGPDRSGTTLLYALLATHPDISMVRRTNMWRWFDRRYGDLSVPANLDRCLSAMARYRRLAVLEPDIERIKIAFREGEPTYGRLFSLFHEQHATRRGRRRWADKSLHTEYCADRIFAELPDAKMIQLVRDPRDRHASIMRRYEGRTKAVAGTTGRWQASVRTGHRNVRRHPDRYLMVRYEDLATRPEPTLRDICGFLHEEYRPELLSMGGVTDGQDWSGNSSFGDFEPGVISTRSIGRFRSVVPPSDIAFIQTVCRRTMAAHDYARYPVAFDGRRRLAFYGRDLPAQWSRLIGWHAGARLRDATGEGVPDHRLTPLSG